MTGVASTAILDACVLQAARVRSLFMNLAATEILADFPDQILADYGIEALHPDQLIDRLLDLDSEVVFAAVKKDRESLKKLPKSADEYLRDLERCRLLQTAVTLRRCREKI